MANFIYERITNNGTTYDVKIPYYDNGKRIYYNKSFSSKKYGNKRIALQLAKEHRDIMQKQLNIDGIILTSESYTPLEVLEMSFELFPVSFETKRKHTIWFNKYISPYVSDDFAKIKPIDIQKTLNNMTSCSKDMINRVHTIWKRLYRTAQFNDIVAQDLTVKVFIPKSRKPLLNRPVNTSKEELDNVCKQIQLRTNPSDAKLIIGALYIMYYTGMRPSEVYALEHKHIDTKNHTINICQSLGSTETEKNVIVPTKTECSVRVIPYPIILDTVFEELNQKILFKRKNGKILDGTFVGNILRRITHGEFRTYMLRHQFSTNLINNNVDIRTIQELMGHTSSSMTLEYARSNEDKMREAIEKIEQN